MGKRNRAARRRKAQMRLIKEFPRAGEEYMGSPGAVREKRQALGAVAFSSVGLLGHWALAEGVQKLILRRPVGATGPSFIGPKDARQKDMLRIRGPGKAFGAVSSSSDVPVTPLHEVAVPSEQLCSSETGQQEPQVAEGEEWPIEALVMGDGSGNSNGCTLQEGEVHASGQARCGHENFHAIVWDDRIFCGARDATIQLPTYALPGGRHRGEVPECVVPAKGATQRCMQVKRSVRVAEAVFHFLKKYPGVIVVLQKVGARGNSPELLMMRVRGAGRLRVTRETHDCVQAALLNGLAALWECEADKAAAVNVGAAVLAAEGQRGLVFRNLAPIGEVVNKMQGGLARCLRATVQGRTLGREAHCFIHVTSRRRAFEWLAAKTDGVFIVRLLQDPVVDHAICVDARQGVIMDSEEGYPVNLTVRALELCGGETAKRLRVAEIRQLTKVDQLK